jgi:hypothetical protein
MVVAAMRPQTAAAAETRYFEHDDRRLLQPHQKQGGAVLLVDELSQAKSAPLVVLLHGTNATGDKHLWLGGGDRDLRPLAIQLVRERKVRPFVLAAPSQTKAADNPRTLWNGIDLSVFVADVARASADVVQINRAQIIVVGHSGAGCNPTGPFVRSNQWTEQALVPRALVLVDPCLDAEIGTAVARRAWSTPLTVLWQSGSWPRSPERFWSALRASSQTERAHRMVELPVKDENPHDAILPIAMERVLVKLLGPP